MIQLSKHAYKYSEAYGLCAKLSNQASYKYCGLNLLVTPRVHRFDLTRWGRDEMADIFRLCIQIYFISWKLCDVHPDFADVSYLESN